MDEKELRERIRTAVAAGKLPDRPPERTWGGPGSGKDCALCGEPAMAQEAELELDYISNDGRNGPVCLHVHARCWQLWESERQSTQGRTPPPTAQTPESRNRADGFMVGGGPLMGSGTQGTIADRERDPNDRWER
jgi:hypothetical protein